MELKLEDIPDPETVAKVLVLLGDVIRPEMFRLYDGTFEARLTVNPDFAFAALQQKPV